MPQAITSILNGSRFYFKPADDKGAGGDPPVDELEAVRAEMLAEEEAAKAEAEKEAEEEEESSKEEEGQDEEPPEVPETKPLTDEEVLAEAQKRGLIPEPKQSSTPTDDDSPPETPNFRAQAYEQAWKYKQFVTEDENGTPELTQKGVEWAEERAIVMAAEHTVLERENRQAVQSLEANKPALILDTVEQFKKAGMPAEMASPIATDYINILTSYGLSAFDDGATERDPAKKAEKERTAKGLRTTAYYIARGMQADRDDKAKAEGGDEGDKAHEKVSAKSENGSLYSGLSAADRNFIEKEWVPAKNGGKPATKAQLEALKAEGVIG